MYQVGALTAQASANVACYAIVDGNNLPTHPAGSIVVKSNYDLSLDGNLLQGVRFFGDGYRTHSLVMTLNPNNVSFRDTVHMTGKPGPRGVRLY